MALLNFHGKFLMHPVWVENVSSEIFYGNFLGEFIHILLLPEDVEADDVRKRIWGNCTVNRRDRLWAMLADSKEQFWAHQQGENIPPLATVSSRHYLAVKNPEAKKI
jgi:hypothetical protein